MLYKNSTPYQPTPHKTKPQPCRLASDINPQRTHKGDLQTHSTHVVIQATHNAGLRHTSLKHNPLDKRTPTSILPPMLQNPYLSSLPMITVNRLTAPLHAQTFTNMSTHDSVITSLCLLSISGWSSIPAREAAVEPQFMQEPPFTGLLRPIRR